MHEGGCLCGRLRYGVRGQPKDVINCHCRFCQRATGGAYLVETLFDKPDLTVIAGSPKVYDHVSEGSGKVIHVHFCPDCGTKLFLTFERFPEIVGVFSGTFDDTNWFERTAETRLHFFLECAQDGTVLPAGEPVYPAHYWQGEGVPSTPQVFDAPVVVDEDVRRAAIAFGKTNRG
ncbi:GFA family protein [Ostreiculturibacter nitratireducens]|uniref:GFA family protein n=1 Tax=Ostreiculturibacter nitratireducens TaxID=3075226 RepID=UPI0031B5FCDA